MANFSSSKRIGGEKKKGKGKGARRKEMNAAFPDSLALLMTTITGRLHHSGTVRTTSSRCMLMGIRVDVSS